VNKYTVKFEPEIPDNARAMRKEVLKLCRDKIKESLEFYIDWGLCVFSLKKVAELPVYECELEGQKYTATIEWVQVMEKTDRPHELPEDLLQLDDALPQVRVNRLENFQRSQRSYSGCPQHQSVARV